MNILNKLTIKSLKLNKKRTIVTIIGIILSGAMICGVASIAASFQDALVRSAIETDGNYHASFYDVEYDNIKYISDNAYTQESMLSRDLGYSKFEKSEMENKPYILIKEYDDKAFESFPITLKKGRLPEKAGELVVSEDIFRMGGPAYGIGQRVTLEMGRRIDVGVEMGQLPISETEALEPLITKTYTITGIIERPRFESSDNPGFTALSYLDQNLLVPGDKVNVSILAKDPRDIYQKAPEIAQSVGAGDVSYNNEVLKWMGVSRNERYNNLLVQVTLILILLIVVGSVAVIYNAFAISVSERKKQFGMLSSVGATARQIRRMVLYEGFVLGAIGIPLGILSGIGGIGVTLKIINNIMKGSIFGTDLGLRLVISPVAIIATICFIVLTILLSAYIPAKRAGMVSPVDAIRLSTDIKVKAKKLKTSKLTRLLFGFEGELGLKNLKRNSKRYRATVFSLFISIVLFISFSSFMTYSFKSADMYLGDIPYDIIVQKYDTGIEEQRELFNSITALDGVERHAVVREIYSEAEGLDRSQLGSYLQKYQIDQGYSPADEEGKYSMPCTILTIGNEEFKTYAREKGIDTSGFYDTDNFKGILINKNIIEKGKLIEYEPMNMERGDKLKLKEFEVDKTHTPYSYTMEIGAVTNSLPFGISYTGSENLVILVSEEVFEAVRSNLHEVYKKDADRATLTIKAEDAGKLEEEIRTIHGQDGSRSLYLHNMTAMVDADNRVKTVANIFVYGFVTLIALIGVTNIFNTISTNIALRRRELAMLKSVGLTPEGFNKMIRYESLFYGLKALLYGLPVSVLISLWMYNSFGSMFGFALVLPWKEIIYCIVGVFVIVFITMAHSSAKLKKENIIDALKEENL